MPTTSIDITGTTDRSRVQALIPIESGLLVAASAFPLVEGTDPATCWAEVGLMSDNTDLQNRVALLDAGYLGTAAPVGWTGQIKGAPKLFVYLHVYSSVAVKYRLSVTLEAV